LLLTSLLFVFNTENRAEENGLFLALGFSTKAVRGLVLREAAILVVIGSLLGSFAGILYNLLILKALETVWRGAVGTSVLHFHFKLSSIFLGASAGMVAALFTIWLVTRRQVSQSISGLQKGLAKIETVWKKKPGMSLFVGISSLIAVEEAKTPLRFSSLPASCFSSAGWRWRTSCFTGWGKTQEKHLSVLFTLALAITQGKGCGASL
jgi:putative ABC transport system permease protein